jgi:hypothetical protein
MKDTVIKVLVDMKVIHAAREVLITSYTEPSHPSDKKVDPFNLALVGLENALTEAGLFTGDEIGDRRVADLIKKADEVRT